MNDIQTDLGGRICEAKDQLAALLLDDHADDARSMLWDLANSALADATARDLRDLQVEIRRRRAAQDLLSVVTLDQLQEAAWAGFARWWQRDGAVVRFLWYRACGWHPCGAPSWTDGERVLLDAHLTSELYAAAIAPVLVPLTAHWRALVSPLTPIPDHSVAANRLQWLVGAVTEARQQIASLSEVDAGTASLIQAAGAGAALFSGDKEMQAAYLVGRGWHRLGSEFNFALPNGSGGNFGGVALRKQVDDDFEPFVRTWPAELERAAKPFKRPAEKAQSEPVGA